MTGGYRCAVAACKNQSGKEPKISFFSFPKDDTLQQEWVRRCNRQERFNPNTSRICRNHFTDSDIEFNLKSEIFNMSQKPRLKAGVVPTLHLTASDAPDITTYEFMYEELKTEYTLLKVELEKKNLEMITLQSQLEQLESDRNHCILNHQMPSRESHLTKEISCNISPISNSAGERQLQENITVDKFPHICRTCLSRKAGKSIFKLNYKDVGFHRIFEMCTSVLIKEGDAMPQNICFPCVNEIIRMYVFRLKVIQANEVLRDVLKNFVDLHTEIVVKMEESEFNPSNKADGADNMQIKTEHLEDIQKETDAINEEAKAQEVALNIAKKRKFVTYSCNACYHIFQSSRELLDHCKQYGHPRPRLVSRNQVFQHIQAPSKDKPLFCPYCGLRFILKFNLQRHIRTHIRETPFVCETCGEGFYGETRLKDHKAIHTTEAPYLCSHCKKSYSNKSTLKRHLNWHDLEDLRKSKQFTYKCDTCNKQFFTIPDLKKHRFFHGEKKYLCCDCGKRFYTKRGLKEHAETHSAVIRPFSCPLCKKTFTQQRSLRQHALVHTEDKPFTCEICEKAFKQKCHLKQHMRTHSDDRRFVCKFCEKCFTTKHTLTAHIRTHTGETPFMCDVCGERFSIMSSMKRHRMRKHEKMMLVKEVDTCGMSE